MSHSCLANGRTDGGHGGLWKTIFIQIPEAEGAGDVKGYNPWLLRLISNSFVMNLGPSCSAL